MNNTGARLLALALTLLALSGSTIAGGSAAAVPSTPGAPTQTWQLATDEVLQVIGTELRIQDATGRVITRNPGLVRRPDATGECPADGFIGIEVIADGFLLQQQNCSGWSAINETLRFERRGPGRYDLTRVTFDYYDRREPDADAKHIVGTAQQFGAKSLADVVIDELYHALRQ